MTSPTTRQTADPLPLPSSPANTDTLLTAGGDAAPASGASTGIPFAGQSGIAQEDADAADRRDAAGARPAASGDGARQAAPVGQSTANTSDAQPATTAPAGADGEPGREDGALESLGKAISSPIRGAAEDEEPA